MMATDRRPTTTPPAALGTAEQFSAMLRGSAVPTIAAAVACVVLAVVMAGGKGAWSAALGAALVVVFFSLSLLVMKRTAAWDPTAVMGVVLGTYTAKIIALGVAMVLLRDATWLSGQALALTVIVCTVVWLAFEMRAFTRLRVLVSPGAENTELDAGEGGQ
ncbi:MAG TPA: hypothetical protein VFL94_13170 [Actinomycetales bacterium]|nr:hypothetical protein [Actinomycetales bacterium]